MPTGSSATSSSVCGTEIAGDLVGGLGNATKKKEKTRIVIRGDETVLMMRCYPFAETRHSAMISVFEYQVRHAHDFENGRVNEHRSN